MKKLIVVFSLFLSVGAYAQQADSVKKDLKVNLAYGSLPPLVMVDGVKYTGNINNLNSDNIQSVDILKSPSATSSYGSEGLNGVILVTTKKGRAAGANQALSFAAKADSTVKAPLYIIDGNVSNSAYFKKLNPADIDNISILKDASAKKIYGAGGKNGVVIVVTKAYKKQQQLKKAEVERQGKRD
jgi:TonB-dependent SusC/RagA subfamily outer membrane receptor